MTSAPAEDLDAGGTNAVGRMLGLLGDEWTLLVIQQAVLGATRYRDFMERLPISHAVLTNRLRVLTDTAMLRRAEGRYLPTERSRSLWPLLALIWEWERGWVPDHAGHLPAMYHRRCGQPSAPVLRCCACQEEVTVQTVDVELGPSGNWGRSVPVASTRRRSDPGGAVRTAGLFPETMTVLGNRWAAALLLACFLGTSRFTDFQSQLGAPPSVLSERLQSFCGLGVLNSPERGVYGLTDKGRAFFGVLLVAVQWAQRWFHAPEGPAIVTNHRDCPGIPGGPLTVELVCSACRGRLAGAEVEVVSGAEGSESR